MLDNLKTNFRKITDGFVPFKAEWDEQTFKVAEALGRWDILDALHHFSGYRQAAQEHLHKVWFYTFWPKWGVVIYLIWGNEIVAYTEPYLRGLGWLS